MFPSWWEEKLDVVKKRIFVLQLIWRGLVAIGGGSIEFTQHKLFPTSVFEQSPQVTWPTVVSGYMRNRIGLGLADVDVCLRPHDKPPVRFIVSL